VPFTVDDLVELLGLGAFRDKFVSELSTGSRRIVDLAMSIAHDPKVPAARRAQLGHRPARDRGARAAAGRHPARHRLRDAHHRARHAAHHRPVRPDRRLELGRVVLQGTPDEVLADPRMSSSYLGGDLSTIQRSGADEAPHKPDPTSRPRPTRRAAAGCLRRGSQEESLSAVRPVPPGRSLPAALTCAGAAAASAAAAAEPERTGWWNRASRGP
jgi:hypothetical protein